MPLYGLPGVPSGTCTVAAGASVLLSTSGLALLRRTRPSISDEGDEDDEPEGCMDDDSAGNLLGLLGAVELYLGLVLGELPFILGVSTDNEGKVAALLGNCLIPACWAVERFWLSDAPLPTIQSAVCAVIMLACTIIDWAGPTPYDDMRLGFASQTAGCDGGFRSPFVLYVSAWVTGLVFGTLLLFFEEGAIFSCGERRRWTTNGLAIRQKALPLIYGLATSMSCVLFATGSASNDMSWVTAGVLLLVISVVCTWDCLWCLDMNLATYGALFHGFATGLRAIQNHAIFRDLRWDPPDAHGILVVYEYPGLQIFMFGLFLMFLCLQFYLYTCHWKEWKSVYADEADPSSHVYDSLTMPPGKLQDKRTNGFDHDVPGSGSRWWQWVLLPLCITCQIIGVHVPLIYTECVLPKLTWFQDDPDGYKVSEGESYIDVIRWLYQRKLPCSALVAAYNAMLLPPLQFLMIFLILLHPRFLPAELRRSMQNYVMTLAPMRFTQPSIMMLVVGVASLPMENQHPDNIQYGGHFTSGYWFFLTYCISNLILAWSVQPPEQPESHEVAAKKIRRDPLLQLELKKHWQMEDSDEDVELLQGSKASFSVAAPLAIGVAIATCIWLALTNPYLEFEFRIAGVVIHRVRPSVLDLWYSIGSVNHFLMCYCAATLIIFPFLWLVLLCVRLASGRPGLEPMLRPFVMCHIWAASLVLVYYIVTARNKNIMEVCASIPSVPIAPVAIVFMGAGTFALIHMAKALHQEPMAPNAASSMRLPPGGKALWMGGPALTILTIGGLLSTCGPVRPPALRSLQDLNEQFVQVGPVLNEHLYEDVSESFGDCEALWKYRVSKGEVSADSLWEKQTCSGTTPLFQKEVEMGTAPQRHRIKTMVLWAKGVNSLVLERVRVQAPLNPLVAVQNWYLNVSAAFDDLHVFMKVFVDDKEWYSGYICCDHRFHFALQVTAACEQHQGFKALHLNLMQMDEVPLAHDATVIHGPAWAAVTSDVGRQEMVKQVVADFLSLQTGQVLLQSLNEKASQGRRIAGDMLSDVVLLNTGQICVTDP